MQLSEITARLLDRANLKPGMRVLDLGCGHGEVSRAIATRVGPDGSVVGIDVNASVIESARTATRHEGLDNLEFVLGDLASVPLVPESFDCVVGRRVLMYVPDPRRVLSHLMPALRRGGRVALQEHDATMTPGRVGAWPVHDQVHGWIWETVRREGANPSFGLAMAPMLAEVGLRIDRVWAQTIFAGHERGVHNTFEEIVGFIRSRIVALGVATQAEIDLPTLGRRLASERDLHRTMYAADLAVCVVASRAT